MLDTVFTPGSSHSWITTSWTFSCCQLRNLLSILFGFVCVVFLHDIFCHQLRDRSFIFFFYENLSPLFAIIHTLYRRKILKKTKMKKGTLESLFSEILWKKKLLINYSGYWLEQGCKTKVFYRRALLNLLLLMRGNKYGQ